MRYREGDAFREASNARLSRLSAFRFSLSAGESRRALGLGCTTTAGGHSPLQPHKPGQLLGDECRCNSMTWARPMRCPTLRWNSSPGSWRRCGGFRHFQRTVGKIGRRESPIDARIERGLVECGRKRSSMFDRAGHCRSAGSTETGPSTTLNIVSRRAEKGSGNCRVGPDCCERGFRQGRSACTVPASCRRNRPA